MDQSDRARKFNSICPWGPARTFLSIWRLFDKRRSVRIFSGFITGLGSWLRWSIRFLSTVRCWRCWWRIVATFSRSVIRRWGRWWSIVAIFSRSAIRCWGRRWSIVAFSWCLWTAVRIFDDWGLRSTIRVCYYWCLGRPIWISDEGSFRGPVRAWRFLWSVRRLWSLLFVVSDRKRSDLDRFWRSFFRFLVWPRRPVVILWLATLRCRIWIARSRITTRGPECVQHLEQTRLTRTGLVSAISNWTVQFIFLGLGRNRCQVFWINQECFFQNWFVDMFFVSLWSWGLGSSLVTWLLFGLIRMLDKDLGAPVLIRLIAALQDRT